MTHTVESRPLIAHVLFCFAVGGLENGVVNLINHLPRDRYRHVVISLTQITDFKKRIVRDDVTFIALEKEAGHTLWIYPRLWRLFRRLRPAIVHSRNLAALEVAVPAWAAGVPVRIHGEHGRDVGDFDGSSKKGQWLRRLYRPFVTHYIALSRDLADYLTCRVGMSPSRVAQIYNGVDVQRFHPAKQRQAIEGCPFSDAANWLVGTVGRMQIVKDQTTLAAAFIRALAVAPDLKTRLRLVMIGDGPLRARAQAMLEEAGLAALAWLPGQRDDVPEILRGLDCFVLPSLAEGVSNTILEAMASGLPVIATNVGGNGELIEAGVTGELVTVADPEAMARQIAALATDPQRARLAGLAGRARVEQQFSLQAMSQGYQGLYERLLAS
ncbi:MAG: TIGR03088 family PEP-CTERM/XrtA system glycosyltransferase [Candidatus Accumulibacter sp.]|nr:TIGR03088 family PEP-CTERM/XrtA system glycosyltransferase [Accumulibacter sp.]